MRRPACALFLAVMAASAAAQQATYEMRSLTPAAALKAAQAALADCTRKGFQVAVAVTDRGGVPLVMLRERHAGAHTPDAAVNKAWSALSFKVDTLGLERATRAGEGSSGIRNLPRVTAVGGGRFIEAAGSLVGGIGVSGAPNGDSDDTCARAGVAAIADELEL